MRLSTDRILTTHAGSLPRPDDLLETLYDRSDGRQLSAEASSKIQAAVTQAVRQQANLMRPVPSLLLRRPSQQSSTHRVLQRAAA